MVLVQVVVPLGVPQEHILVGAVAVVSGAQLVSLTRLVALVTVVVDLVNSNLLHLVEAVQDGVPVQKTDQQVGVANSIVHVVVICVVVGWDTKEESKGYAHAPGLREVGVEGL